MGELHGQGACAVCGARIRRGLLMCARDWSRVPRPVQHEVYRQLDRWNAGEATLGDLQAAQQAAINAVSPPSERESAGQRIVSDNEEYP